MPKPVPPPPPQASADETAQAVRLVQILSAVTVGLFLLIASTYHAESWLVNMGRDNGTSWNLHKLEMLDTTAVRGHAGERVAWIVGSSVVRDGINEANTNSWLKQLSSEWRVVKFGQTRGASGLASHFLERIPTQPGDMVVHNVILENFRDRWVKFSKVPGWRLQLLLDVRDVWKIEEWTVQQKIEETVAWPRDFYRYREDNMIGWNETSKDLLNGRVPRTKKTSFHIRFNTRMTHNSLKRWREIGQASHRYMEPDDMSFEPGQFNVDGLARLRAHCQENGLELRLVHVPPRQEYVKLWVHPEVAIQWKEWLKAQPEMSYFPQVPEDHYLDMNHANRRGRKIFSRYMASWLDSQERGTFEREVLSDWEPMQEQGAGQAR
jgi:hypothetical protein